MGSLVTSLSPPDLLGATSPGQCSLAEMRHYLAIRCPHDIYNIGIRVAEQVGEQVLDTFVLTL